MPSIKGEGIDENKKKEGERLGNFFRSTKKNYSSTQKKKKNQLHTSDMVIQPLSYKRHLNIMAVQDFSTLSTHPKSVMKIE